MTILKNKHQKKPEPSLSNKDNRWERNSNANTCNIYDAKQRTKVISMILCLSYDCSWFVFLWIKCHECVMILLTVFNYQELDFFFSITDIFQFMKIVFFFFFFKEIHFAVHNWRVHNLKIVNIKICYEVNLLTFTLKHLFIQLFNTFRYVTVCRCSALQ